ncbi:MAG TPA: hypothetical protein DCS15_03880 [Flavobacteriales bacterium]|nr:hypothetical protein [Flavobacteriales bacterium]
MRKMKLLSAALIAFTTVVISCNHADTEELEDSVIGREEWMKMRLADPLTGEIPLHMHERELAFAQGLPKLDESARSSYTYTHRGPFNVGGRTRAFAIDYTNTEILLAGGISGGMWKSDDNGMSWRQVGDPNDHPAVSCLTQDLRPGKSNIWYYGSGEIVGNSASKSFSAYFNGTGIYKSVDNGETWTVLDSTSSGTPEETDNWDLIWNVAIDHSVDTADVLYAAVRGSIQRSDDGGSNWQQVLGGGSTASASRYTDVLIAENGVKYAILSAGGNSTGLWRSEDGISWQRIGATDFPSNINRVIMDSDPQNPNKVYFLGETPGFGQKADSNSSETNSLFRYTYLSGNGAGAGGQWENLSLNLPFDSSFAACFKTQGSYDMVLAVHPKDSNVIAVGGTNLFLSFDGFNSDSNYKQIGGYRPDGYLPFYYRWVGHHPDQHVFFFHPDHPDTIYNANDGGVYRMNNIRDTSNEWTDLNKGFLTTQFYTIAVDRDQPGSELVFGGLQDNGTFLSWDADPSSEWATPSLGDGAYCAVGNGEDFYFSSQYARIYKMSVGQDGNRTGYTRIDPESPGFWQFVNPFILDRNDPYTMYLSDGDDIWRHNSLNAFDLDSSTEDTDDGWEEFRNIGRGSLTTLESSYDNPQYVLYMGSSNKSVFRVEDANDGNLGSDDITNNIVFGGYASDISVDPEDADKLMLVYSNYKTQSVYYSDNGGDSWTAVSGNLEAEQAPGAPVGLALGDGPSVRSCLIAPLNDDSRRYFVGTSVGLFSTNQLQGDSTVWEQEAPNVIGNAIVDMMDYRPSDGFLAIGTHGKGVFTTFITDRKLVAGKHELEPTVEVKIWPNPSKGLVEIESQEKILDIKVFDLQGRAVQHVSVSGSSLHFAKSASGTYLIEVETESGSQVKKIVIE